ncbi:MAG: right-handed parallel beta-helix repeat-containing protein, partial [Candidatus Bathyarchaeota archaeon]|nr:right-handed parallel beta-helix repeat-containing protein [Candidatus Bathyarchaeum sp.]
MRGETRATVLLLILYILVAFPNVGIVRAEGTIHIRDDGTVEGTDKIQRDGSVYTFTSDISGSIIVEKDDVVIDGAGYTLQGNGSGYGIHLIHRSYVTIGNLEIREFDTGIRFYGGSNNTILENSLANNEWGIYLEYSKNNTISGNNLTNNDKGIRISISPNNVLRDNQIENNRYNFKLIGVNFEDYVNDIDASNTVDGKPIYYWVNIKDKTIPLDAGHVTLVNCTGITVKNLNLTNNREGIQLAFTENSTITQNTITNNFEGIFFYGSSGNNISANYIANNEANGISIRGGKNNLLDNTIINNGANGVLLYFSNYNIIRGNNIIKNNCGLDIYGSKYNSISGNSVTNNSMAGLWFFGSHSNYLLGNNITDNGKSMIFEMQCLGNVIYYNNFVNNELQFQADESSVNKWDNGTVGNYWTDYTGTDWDGDGIGDTPYIIDENNRDNYPMMEPVGAPMATVTIFDAGTWEGEKYNVNVVSNSTVSGFSFDPEATRIRFNAMGESGTTGFCRVTIPKALLYADETKWAVLVDGNPVTPSVNEDESSTYIYFTCNQSAKTVEIIGT